jgi:hypothetical protein
VIRFAFIAFVGTVAILGGCSPSEETQSGAGLRSDVPLRSVQYFVEHQAEAAEMRAICDQWKGSQRPMASWPAVVTQNCTNIGLAAAQTLRMREREKRRQQMGI